MLVTSTEELGREIRRRRKELGYTQVFLSDASGLSASFLSDVENGKETCEIGKCMRLVQLLGLDIRIVSRTAR